MKDTPFMQLVRARTSVRSFDPRPVPDEAILAIIEAARLAPSAQNTQPWRFIVVRDPTARERFCRDAFSGIYAGSMKRFAGAPAFIALCVVKDATERMGAVTQKVSYSQIDCGIAGAHCALAAAELGLGTCWIGMFDRRKTRRTLGVPAGVDVPVILALGYPAAGQERSGAARKPLSAILWQDAWGHEFAGSVRDTGYSFTK